MFVTFCTVSLQRSRRNSTSTTWVGHGTNTAFNVTLVQVYNVYVVACCWLNKSAEPTLLHYWRGLLLQHRSATLSTRSPPCNSRMHLQSTAPRTDRVIARSEALHSYVPVDIAPWAVIDRLTSAPCKYALSSTPRTAALDWSHVHTIHTHASCWRTSQYLTAFFTSRVPHPRSAI